VPGELGFYRGDAEGAEEGAGWGGAVFCGAGGDGLNAFFASAPAADFNRDDQVNSQGFLTSSGRSSPGACRFDRRPDRWPAPSGLGGLLPIGNGRKRGTKCHCTNQECKAVSCDVP
jgi:hypothetical protein